MPRYSCIWLICSIYFEGTNELSKLCLTGTFLHESGNYWGSSKRVCGGDPVKGRLGIVYADYPGSGLIEAIINNNLDENDKFLHLGGPNSPPMASIAAPDPVDEGSEIEFDGSGSSDPDSDGLSYVWDTNLPNCQINELQVIRNYNEYK